MLLYPAAICLRAAAKTQERGATSQTRRPRSTLGWRSLIYNLYGLRVVRNVNMPRKVRTRETTVMAAHLQIHIWGILGELFLRVLQIHGESRL